MKLGMKLVRLVPVALVGGMLMVAACTPAEEDPVGVNGRTNASASPTANPNASPSGSNSTNVNGSIK